jgi:hypothetical protein
MEMAPRNALLLGAAVAALVTGIVVAILLPPRTCGQVGNSFFNPRVICVGVPSWVRAVVVGTAAVIACVLAAVAVGPHRSEGSSSEDND